MATIVERMLGDVANNPMVETSRGNHVSYDRQLASHLPEVVTALTTALSDSPDRYPNATVEVRGGTERTHMSDFAVGVLAYWGETIDQYKPVDELFRDAADDMHETPDPMLRGYRRGFSEGAWSRTTAPLYRAILETRQQVMEGEGFDCMPLVDELAFDASGLVVDLRSLPFGRGVAQTLVLRGQESGLYRIDTDITTDEILPTAEELVVEQKAHFFRFPALRPLVAAEA